MKPVKPYATQCKLCGRKKEWGVECGEYKDLPFWAMPVLGADMNNVYVKCVAYERHRGNSAAFERCFIWSDDYVDNPY